MKINSILVGAVAATSTFFASPSMATPQSQFPDVEPTNWAYQAILSLSARYGCAYGYPNGTFVPGRPASRAELAALTNHCLDNITKFMNDADAKLAADLRAEFDPRLTALEVAAERKELGIGNYAGLAFSGYSTNGDVNADDYNAGVTLTGRARVYEWESNVAISLRPELSFVDNNQTTLGGAVTVDYPVSTQTLMDGSKVSSWNVYGGAGVGGAIGSAEGTYNMYGQDIDGYGVVGTEISVSNNFVAFANVKFPFSENSVDNYSPVGTIGAGFKF